MVEFITTNPVNYMKNNINAFVNWFIQTDLGECLLCTVNANSLLSDSDELQVNGFRGDQVLWEYCGLLDEYKKNEIVKNSMEIVSKYTEHIISKKNDSSS